MLSAEKLAAAKALEDFHRALGEQVRYEQHLQRNKKDWVDGATLHEIHAYEADVEPHFSVGTPADLDDIRYAIRAELGRDFDTASLQLADGDPERWYECGDETWEPEEPPAVSDLQIHRMALARERRRKADARESTILRAAWRGPLGDRQIEYIATQGERE